MQRLYIRRVAAHDKKVSCPKPEPQFLPKPGTHGHTVCTYSRSPKVGNSIASSLKSNVWGIPALFGLNQVSNFMGFTVGLKVPVYVDRYMEPLRAKSCSRVG